LEQFRKILRLARCDFLLQVHDEAIYRVIPSAAEECLNILADIMSWRHYFPATSGYNVPLVSEGGIGENWKHAKSDDALVHVKTGYDEWNKYA
jgi:DNA polymerase I-like protein with 3'-5' exonuclease and polymerase domains